MMDAGQINEWSEAIAEATIQAIEPIPFWYKRSLLKSVAQLAAAKAMNDLARRGRLKYNEFPTKKNYETGGQYYPSGERGEMI